MIKSLKKYPFRWALLASLLLHVVLFLGTGVGLSWLRLVELWPAPVVAQAEARPRPPIVFEVMETPNSARREKAPEHAAHASDKNAVAQNPNAPQNLPLGAAYAQGDLPNADATTRTPASAAATPAPAEAREQRKEAKPRNEQPAEAAQSYAFTQQSFRREFLTGQRSPATPSAPAQAALRDNRGSRAPQLGSFSLDTYEWNFAPYMLWLKKRVQGNIYPPPAFTHMGLISGQTFLRFKIYRDGTLKDLELLNYRGHKTLMETSMRAIELSVPLQKLPPDFPKDYLEVTAQFDYTLLNSPPGQE